MASVSDARRIIRVESKFSKSGEKKETNLFTFLRAKIIEVFIVGIPMKYIQRLPKRYLFPLGTCAYIILLAAFTCFFLQAADDKVSATFISFSEDSGDCDTVGTSVTNNFLATTTGSWEGSPDFLYSDAAYDFSFTDLVTTQSDFQSALVTLDESLKQLGQEAESNQLVYNLLQWTHFKYTFEVDGKKQVFTFAATPNDVFNRDFLYGGTGNANLTCAVVPHMTYNKESAKLSIEYSYSEFVSAQCDDIINPYNLGFGGDGDSFDVHFDMVSHTTALAVNFGTIRLESLETVNTVARDNVTYISTTNVVYNCAWSQVFDPQFPRMTPIWCLQCEGGSELVQYCFIAIPNNIYQPGNVTDFDNAYGIPFMDHFEPTCQNCPTPGEGEPDALCNDFDLLVGIVVYKTEYAIFDLAFEYRDKKKTLNDLTFNATRAVVDYEDPVESNFDFCSGECSILAINAFDYLDHSITPYFFGLVAENGKAGACNDSFTTTSWNKLYQNDNLPAPLIEKYFECKAYTSDALIYAVGIASGNTASFGTPLVFILLPVFYLYLKASNRDLKDSHSIHEKNMAELELVTRLLHIRDENELHLLPDNSILQRIVDELNFVSARSREEFIDRGRENQVISPSTFTDTQRRKSCNIIIPNTYISPIHNNNINDTTTTTNNNNNSNNSDIEDIGVMMVNLADA